VYYLKFYLSRTIGTMRFALPVILVEYHPFLEVYASAFKMCHVLTRRWKNLHWLFMWVPQVILQVLYLIPSSSPMKMSRTSMRAQAATRSAALRREDLQREAAVRDLMEISQGHGSSQGIAHGSLPADDSREIADKAITRLRVKSNNKDVGLAHAIDTILTHPVAQGLIIIGFLLSVRRMIESWANSLRHSLEWRFESTRS
jgi:Fe2+ transport system protein B